MELLSKAANYLTGFTAKFYLALIVALIACLPLAYCKGRSDGHKLTEARYVAARAQAVAQARKADGVAIETAQAGRAASEAEIDKGRAAAKAGPDPWKQATEAMR